MDSVWRSISGSASRLRDNPYTLQSYPREIPPQHPGFSRCVPEFGRELAKRDCKEAVKNMPWLKEGKEVDWSVNFVTQKYNLPMSIGWTIPKSEAGAGTEGMESFKQCVVGCLH